MNRYKINLTALQWSQIALDLKFTGERSPSTDALGSLIRIALEHAGDPEFTDLPYNVEVVDDGEG